MMRMVGYGLGALCGLLPALLVAIWIGSAQERLQEAETIEVSDEPDVAVAAHANEEYCTPALQKILRRVLQSCGLISGGGGRGCQPVEAKNVATMDDADFNALFVPMKGRGGIVQFEQESAELDPQDKKLIEEVFADRRGASYFLVVSRASPEGSVQYNRELSQKRAEAALQHLQDKFQDPELERQVGLLWLGEEYAQLDPTFCSWKRSGSDGSCSPESLNRSAFIAWIDCTL